jgi:hypothetical protein
MSSDSEVLDYYLLNETDIQRLQNDKDAEHLFGFVNNSLNSVKEAFAKSEESTKGDLVALQKIRHDNYKMQVRNDDVIDAFINDNYANYDEWVLNNKWVEDNYPVLQAHIRKMDDEDKLLSPMYKFPNLILEFASQKGITSPEVYKDEIINNYIEFKPVFQPLNPRIKPEFYTESLLTQTSKKKFNPTDYLLTYKEYNNGGAKRSDQKRSDQKRNKKSRKQKRRRVRKSRRHRRR